MFWENAGFLGGIPRLKEEGMHTFVLVSFPWLFVDVFSLSTSLFVLAGIHMSLFNVHKGHTGSPRSCFVLRPPADVISTRLNALSLGVPL